MPSAARPSATSASPWQRSPNAARSSSDRLPAAGRHLNRHVESVGGPAATERGEERRQQQQARMRRQSARRPRPARLGRATRWRGPPPREATGRSRARTRSAPPGRHPPDSRPGGEPAPTRARRRGALRRGGRPPRDARRRPARARPRPGAARTPRPKRRARTHLAPTRLDRPRLHCRRVAAASLPLRVRRIARWCRAGSTGPLLVRAPPQPIAVTAVYRALLPVGRKPHAARADRAEALSGRTRIQTDQNCAAARSVDGMVIGPAVVVLVVLLAVVIALLMSKGEW